MKNKLKRAVAAATLMAFMGSALPLSVLTAAAKEGNGVVVGNVRVQTLSQSLARIEVKGPNGFEDRVTYNIANRDWDMAEYEIVNTAETVLIKTDSYTVSVPQNATSLENISITTPEGRVIWEYESLPSTREYLPEPGDTPDAWEIADTPRIVPAEWGYDEMPAGETEFADYSGWDTTNDAADMYIFVAKGNYKQLLKDFITLTGPSEMIPLKAFGLWYSQYYNYSQSEALEDIDRFAEEGYPLDIFGVDTDWRVGGRTGYELNTSQWPDLEGFFETAHNEKNLMVFFNDHAEPLKSTMFNDDTATNGNHALNTDEVKYRKENLQKYMELGLDFWWYDRNWPHSVISPFEQQGISRDNFGMYVYHSLTLNQNPDKRPLIMGNGDGIDSGMFSRPSNLTSHRYSVQWTGDTLQTSASMKQEITSIIRTGVLNATPYLCSDAGGHAGTLSDNGYVRWSQYASLSPVFRYHSAGGSADRAPWNYGDEAKAGALDYVNMRYRLLPVFYSLAYENYTTGLPINRRLDINYPAYEESQDDTQYLLGDNILVAPIWDYSSSGKDTRSVFIPDGQWINVFNGEAYTGPQTVSITCTTDEMPIFVRSGSVIPSAREVKYVGEKDWSEICLDVYPSTKLSGSFNLYEDEGSSNAYKEGENRQTSLSTYFENGKAVVEIGKAEGSFEGSSSFSNRRWVVRVHVPSNWGEITGVTLDGKAVSGTEIAKLTGEMPFGGQGAASGDGDVYEISFVKPLNEESRLEITFASTTDETLPTHNGQFVSMDDKVSDLYGDVTVDTANNTEWAVYGKNGEITKQGSNIGTVNVTGNKAGVSGRFNYIYGVNTNAEGLGISGKAEFDVKLNSGNNNLSLYIGAEKAKGELVITDKSGKHVKIIELGNLTGGIDKVINLDLYSENAANLSIKLQRTEGSGSVILYAVTVSGEKKANDAEIEVNSFMSDAPANVSFSGDNIKDWVHLGFGSSATAVTRKAGVELLSDPVVNGVYSAMGDYPTMISFNKGEPNASAKDSKTAIKFENSVEFSVPATTGWQELKLYLGLNYSTSTVEVTNDKGEVLAQYIYSNSGVATKCITVQFKADTESVLYVKIARTYGRTGFSRLAGYTLSDLTDAQMITSELKDFIRATEAKNPTVTLKKYTTESVEAYREALLNAKIISRRDPVTQEEVDLAWQNLEAAKQGLTKNPDISTLTNIITGATATASSQANDGNRAELSVDGNRNSRWAAASGGQDSKDWVAFDLGSKKTFDLITLYWESVSTNFEIQVSDDNQNWITVATDDTQTASAGTRFETSTYFETVSARYVRMYSNRRTRDSFGGAYVSLLEAGLYNTGISLDKTAWDELADLVDNEVQNLDDYSENTATEYKKQLTSAKKLFADGETDEAAIAKQLDLLKKAYEKLAVKDINFSLGATAVTSENSDGTRIPENALDGKMNTRWGSANGGAKQTFTVDLGEVRNIYKINLYWESASNDYIIEVSEDGETFTKVIEHKQSVSAGTVVSTEHIFDAVDARYVRLTSNKGAPGLGTYLSLYEIEIIGEADAQAAEEIKKGDVNGDGIINSTDFMQVRRHYLGLYSIPAERLDVADVNSDGNVNSTDFMQIRRHFLGLFQIGA